MKVKIYVTEEDGTTREEALAASTDDGVENEVLNIYEEVQYQYFEGFGGAITDSAGYVFSCLTKEQQDVLLTMYFDAEYMGYNQVRIPMDSCDFSTHVYEAHSDETDEKLEKFSFTDTEKYIIPLLEASEKKAGRKLKICLSAWSPPAYMKTNNSRMEGGTLKAEYRKRWAQYLCRYAEEFKKRGFDVVRMTVQNEPKAVQRWDSCIYSAQEEKEFLRDYLAPALREHHMEDIEIFIWDHNKERVYERARDTIDDTTRNLIAGIAFHWYSGDHFEALDMVRRKFPDKKLVLSESCLEFRTCGREEQTENSEKLAHDMIGNMNHGMDGFYDWNILLDGEGGPNHAGNYCDAPYRFDMNGKKLEERRCLRINWHFAHFIKSGAVRLATTTFTRELDFTAWKNEDGSIVFVLLNRSGKKITSHIRIDGKYFEIPVEKHTIISGKILK